MKSKQIIFTDTHKAELLEVDVREVGANEVLTEMEYTVISGGTERACIMAMHNAGGTCFPKMLGYCGVGKVLKTGEKVGNVAVGDRVRVKFLGIDEKGRSNLSMKDAEPKAE